MARRRSGLMALRAALGAIGGGLEGYGQLQEQKRQQAELARQQERQQMLDLATLSERGWTTPEARTAQLRQAAPGLQSVLSSAASMLSGGPPRALNMASLQEGAGMYGAPAGEITIGGQSLVLPETSTRRQERLAEKAAGEVRFSAEQQRRATETQARLRSEQIDAALEAAGVSAKDRALVRSGAVKPESFILDENQRRTLGLRQAEVELRRREAGREKEGSGRLPSMGLEETRQANIGAQWLRSLSPSQQAEAMQNINQVFTDMPQLRGKGMLAAYYAMPERERELAAMPTQEREIARQAESALGASAPTAAARPMESAAQKEQRRYDRWEAIKAQNPTLSDDEVTAQVLREIP